MVRSGGYMSNIPDSLRTERINVRLTPEELAGLQRLAAHLAVSEQAVVRMLLERASDELQRDGRWPPASPTPILPPPKDAKK
jgi:hypothetical protein